MLAIPVIIKSIPATAVAFMAMVGVTFAFASFSILGSPFYPVLLGGLSWIAAYMFTKNWLYSSIGEILAAVAWVIVFELGVIA